MRNVRRVALGGAPASEAEIRTRLRLFGLLALLVPLFAGLQYLVREAVPRVEIRLVSQDVPSSVPVLVPVDRVVERIVYVPVDRPDTVPHMNAPASLPAAIFQPPPPVQLPAAEPVESRDSTRLAEPLAAVPDPASEVRAPSAEPVADPAPALIATGTYRPQPVAPARAVAPASVPADEATDDADVTDEFVADDVADMAPDGDAIADRGIEWVDVPVMVAVVSPSGDGTSEMSVEMMTVARPRVTETAGAAPADETAVEAGQPADEPENDGANEGELVDEVASMPDEDTQAADQETATDMQRAGNPDLAVTADSAQEDRSGSH